MTLLSQPINSLPPQMPYQVGGSLRSTALSYVHRQADQDLYQALTAGQFCYVLNCRQMGKSSLLVQTLHRLQQIGYGCATLDITSIGSEQITPVQWYRGIVADLWRSFGLFRQVNYKAWWQEQGDITPVQKLQRFIRDVLLEAFPETPLVIFIDEIDSILSLPFPLDDFFACIRFCYNQRAIDPAYQRLTFAIFGVATPADLIQDHQRTPFNIGTAIALQGFQFAEALPLLAGLQGIISPTADIFQEILRWTGGQPFLTQKLCALLWQRYEHQERQTLVVAPGQAAIWVEAFVRDHLIHQWEAQDEPEHLRTIRDRLLRRPQHTGRLLGLYQQILQTGQLAIDDSPEQIDLLLSGLVVKAGNALRVKNPIYREVFNQSWVKHHLQSLRPYSQAFDSWLAAQQQDSSRLLRGQALRDAQTWAQGKHLSDLDYQFLAASVECDRRETQQALEAERAQAIAAQLEQVQRNTRLQRWLLGVTGSALLLSTSLGIMAFQERQQSRHNEQIARQSEIRALTASAQGWFDSGNSLDALIQAIRAQRQLAQLSSPAPELASEADAVLRRVILGIHQINRFSGHQGEITAVAYSPDGHQIASSSKDNTVKLWQPDGKLLHTLSGPQGGVRAIAYSATGDQLATGSVDGTITLWQPTTGTQLTAFTGHKSLVISLAFSPNGQILASGSTDQQIKLWRPDGTLLHTLTGHKAMVRSLAFSPDGQVLASASADNTIKLWQPTDGHLLATLTGHTATVTEVAFSPDGQVLASASADNTIRLWSREGQLLQILQGHRAAVTSIQFSPDGQMLASASEDHSLRFWQPDGVPILAYSSMGQAGTAIAFSPDGNYLVSAGQGDARTVLRWRLNSPLYDVFSGHQAAILATSMSSDGTLLASASSDKTIKLWQPNGTPLQTLKGHEAPVISINFSPDSQALVSTSMDGSLRLWRRDGSPLATYQNPGQNPRNIAGQAVFSPNGQTIAFGSLTAKITLWQPSQHTVTTLSGHHGPVFSLAWSPQGNQLASGGTDNTVKLWNPITHTLINTLTGHTAPVRAIAYSADGKILASASEDHTIKLWDTANGHLLSTLRGHIDQVRDVTFAPDSFQIDGRLVLASASSDKTIKLWTLDGNLITTLDKHAAIVQDVAFSADGQYLISASSDKTIIRWHLQSWLQTDPWNYACDWVRDYLQTNPQISSEDRQHLCPQL